jgi:regulator of protease activity HflC (stomatin/prohibitin superfamily)
MYKEITLPRRLPLKLGWIVALVIIFLLLVLAASAIKRVEPGFAGVRIDYAAGQIAGAGQQTGYAVEQVPAGRFVFINPITQRLAQYPISNQNMTMARRVSEGKVQGDDSVKVVDTNGVTLNIDVSVIYRVMPQKVGDLYTEWAGAQLIDASAPGGDVEDRLVRPAVRSILPNSAASRNYLQIYATEKGKIQQEAEDALRAYLAPKHIDVVALQIREVYLPDTLQQAINSKVAEQQLAEQAQATVQKNIQLASAAQEQAKGEAQSRLIRAQAEADANLLIAKSLTPELVQYQYALKWDGKLPQATGSGAIPFLNVTPSNAITGTASTK